MSLIKLFKRIKNRREELNMSQEELAKKLGYKSRSSINKIEKGENDIPQSKIAAFATALETTPEYLMGWESKSAKPQPAPDQMTIIRLALKDHPDVLKAIESADFATNTINLGDVTINIDDIDLDYIKTSILSAIVMAKQKGENGKLEITVSPKAKLPDT